MSVVSIVHCALLPLLPPSGGQLRLDLSPIKGRLRCGAELSIKRGGVPGMIQADRTIKMSGRYDCSAFLALRDHRRTSSSKTCSGLDLAVDAAAGEDRAEPVVAQGPEFSADPPDLLDLEVEALVAPPVVWNAKISSRQRCRVPYEPTLGARVNGRGRISMRSNDVAGLVDAVAAEQAAAEFLELPGGSNLPLGITRGQPSGQPLPPRASGRSAAMVPSVSCRTRRRISSTQVLARQGFVSRRSRRR